jgi:hypothetical protein
MHMKKNWLNGNFFYLVCHNSYNMVKKNAFYFYF